MGDHMGPEGWFTVGTITLVILALISNRVSVDVAMIGGLTVLMIGDFSAATSGKRRSGPTSADRSAGSRTRH